MRQTFDPEPKPRGESGEIDDDLRQRLINMGYLDSDEGDPDADPDEGRTGQDTENE